MKRPGRTLISILLATGFLVMSTWASTARADIEVALVQALNFGSIVPDPNGDHITHDCSNIVPILVIENDSFISGGANYGQIRVSSDTAGQPVSVNFGTDRVRLTAGDGSALYIFDPQLYSTTNGTTVVGDIYFNIGGQLRFATTPKTGDYTGSLAISFIFD